VYRKIKTNPGYVMLVVISGLTLLSYPFWSRLITPSTFLQLLYVVPLLFVLLGLLFYLYYRYVDTQLCPSKIRWFYLLVSAGLVAVSVSIWDFHGSDTVRILMKRIIPIPLLLDYLKTGTMTATPLRLFLLSSFGTLLTAVFFFLADRLTGIFSDHRTARAVFAWVYFLSIVSVLTCAFSTNLFQTIPGAEYRLFQGGSEGFVTSRLRNEIGFLEDIKANGGFIYYYQDGDVYRYYSRTGFYGSVLKLLQTITRIDPDIFIFRTRIALSALMAAVFAAIALHIRKRRGMLASLLFLLPVPFTFWITAPAKDLIWFSFVMYLPFLFSRLVYPAVLKGRITFRRFLLYSFLVYSLNFLHGYEYIASQILSAAIPVFYYELSKRSAFRALLKRCFLICLAGLGAFLLVFAAHFTQLSLFLGSCREALGHFVNRTEFYVVDYTITYPELLVRWSQVPVFYFRQGNFIPGNGSAMLPANRVGLQQYLNFGNFHLAFVLLTLFLGILTLVFRRRIRNTPQLLRSFQASVNWAVTGYAAMVSSWTWFLARQAMATHFHQAGVVFMIPFALVFYLLIGYTAQSIVDLLLFRKSPAA